MHLTELANIVSGKACGDDVTLAGFSIDGRTLNPSECFVAIKGELFDGHDFVEQALEHGASCLLVSEDKPYPLPYVLVKDTVLALAEMAKHHRDRFTLPTLALTGSCGKTTVKEMVASILPSPSLATRGNLNNHLGVPLSVLALNQSHRYAVFELGANHVGEIAYNVSMVKPDVALITNVGHAHLEGFGSIQNVAHAKAEIFSGLNQDGTLIINLDDTLIVQQAKNYQQRSLTFSLLNDEADVYATDLDFSPSHSQFTLHLQGESTHIKLNVPGKHNVLNALAAAAGTSALGLGLSDIKRGLNAFKGYTGRLEVLKGVQDATIIDDTYNANLDSVKAAIDVLSSYRGQRILILGDLAEVGSELEGHLRAIGEYATARNIDLLLSCGKLSKFAGLSFSGQSKHFIQKAELLDAIKPMLSSKSTVLIKGSRSAKMEEVVSGLKIP